jgi:hypothetical protein
LHGLIGAAKDGIKFGIVNQRKENLSEKQRSLCQLPEHEVKLLTTQQRRYMAKLTAEQADEILEKISGSNNPLFKKIDELICAIQTGDEIEYIQDEE